MGFLLVGHLPFVPMAFHRSAFSAVTPDSPEVRKLVDDGLRYLERKTDNRFGGKCLIGLAFLKSGASPDHPRVQEALAACLKITGQQLRVELMYGHGLGILFLTELDPVTHREKIMQFTEAMKQRQKAHGGWGYDNYRTGDTSQTQYAVLCYWELLRVGLTPEVDSLELCTNWLLRTQDPNGAWGYQGADPGTMERTEQNEIRLSMAVAGLGSVLICGNMLGLLNPGEGVVEIATPVQVEVPDALRLTRDIGKRKPRTLHSSQVDGKRLKETVEMGQRWVAKNFQPKVGSYNFYYLYSLERYKSFEELITGDAPEEPDWYLQGYELCKKSQGDAGGWHSQSASPCATAFAILFLLRSTQKSIKASLGEGMLIGGRGLSANLNRMKMRNGKLTVQKNTLDTNNLLAMLEDPDNQELDELVEENSVLDTVDLGEEQARRIQQIVRSGNPESRRIAVRSLARMRRLEYVPSLLYALTDPDRRVVREARDGLRFVSRRLDGYGLKDNFTDRERYDALDKWKRWYRDVRAGAL